MKIIDTSRRRSSAIQHCLFAVYSIYLTEIGAEVAMAADFFDKIRIFLRLAEKLSLSRAEELTLLTLSVPEWQRWRSLAVPPGAEVPPQLERRMDYALALMARMVTGREDTGAPPNGGPH